MSKCLMMGAPLGLAATMLLAGCGAGVAGDAGMQLNGEATFHSGAPGAFAVARFAISGYGSDTQALASSAAVATTYHVAPDGADNAAGTAAAPFQTLQRAAEVATSGAVVLVAPGTYAAGGPARANGTRITWISTTRGGATLALAAALPGTTGWDTRGAHAGVIGFAVAHRY